jgi:outer membrane murein-binding lipoprotein Lpp
MNYDFQFIINLLVGAMGSYVIYNYTLVSNHEKRIQKLEDTTNLKVEQLQADVKALKEQVTELTKQVAVLAANVHNQKNTENVMNTTLMAILKQLEHNEIK